MKRIVLVIAAVMVLALTTSALSLVRPQGRRSNGDPDEFQARQSLDEGILVAGTSLDASGKTSEGQPPSKASGRKATGQLEVRGPRRRQRVSITFSGRTIFLER